MDHLIHRPHYLESVRTHFESHPVVALLGPRQCGKTTLARKYAEQFQAPHFFDMEDPRDLAALSNPLLALSGLEGLIVIDEVQRMPDLFPILRVLVDQKKTQRFLLLGSASRDLVQQSSETLAGRLAYQEVSPFSMLEVDDLRNLYLYGGFPESYLNPNTAWNWLEQYIRTFLERDIPNLGFSIPPITMRRFWSMLTHYHGNTFNASELSRSLGVSDHTVKRYLDILSGTFMVRQLYPWYENINKRQTKKPKIYIQDSGIFHHLIGINESEQLMRHPKVGASFEGFALEQVIRLLNKRSEDCYYWGIHQEGELDLLLFDKGKRLGFEFKVSDAPVATASMYKALEYLELDALYVVYPGDKAYKLSESIDVVPLKQLPNRFAS